MTTRHAIRTAVPWMFVVGASALTATIVVVAPEVGRDGPGAVARHLGAGWLAVMEVTDWEAERAKLLAALKAEFSDVTDVQFASVGPTIGQEVTRAAMLAVIAASLVILAFLVIAFRKAPHPVRFGVTAIVAMLHDLLVTLGIFSILSLLFGWEADALLLTALLTVISFSVQDTIVVFDRIRENQPKYRGEPLARIVDRSLLETLHRSLAIHLTALFVMASILLFGGATIKPFVAVLLVGVTTGTYSSIFTASQLLVAWDERDLLGTKTARVETQAQTA